jgi:hypothetical protein
MVIHKHYYSINKKITKKKKLIMRGQCYNTLTASMVSIPTLSVVDRGFEHRSGQVRPGQINDNQICIFCFFTKIAALRAKSKDWLAWNQDNVSK